MSPATHSSVLERLMETDLKKNYHRFLFRTSLNWLLGGPALFFFILFFSEQSWVFYSLGMVCSLLFLILNVIIYEKFMFFRYKPLELLAVVAYFFNKIGKALKEGDKNTVLSLNRDLQRIVKKFPAGSASAVSRGEFNFSFFVLNLRQLRNVLFISEKIKDITLSDKISELKDIDFNNLVGLLDGQSTLTAGTAQEMNKVFDFLGKIEIKKTHQRILELFKKSNLELVCSFTYVIIAVGGWYTLKRMFLLDNFQILQLEGVLLIAIITLYGQLKK